MRWTIALFAAALASGTASAAPQSAAQREASALMREGNKLLEQADYVAALEMFRGAYARFPSPKLLLNIGTTLKQLGRFADAVETYEKYLADSSADPKKKKEVKKLLEELNQALCRLRIEVNEPGARVLVDGKELGGSPQAVTLRVEPGTHTIVAEKAGSTPSVATVALAAGEERVVELRLMAAAAPVAPPAAGSSTARTPAEGPSDSDAIAITERDSADAPSRAGTLGPFVRLDIDPISKGAGVAACVLYGLGDEVDLVAGALLGKTFGVYAGGVVYLVHGSLRPLLAAGMPIYFKDGARVGLHAAAGLALEVGPNFSGFVAIGIEQFITTPPNFRSTLLVPSVGAQLRL